ncbi:MAG: hypothetical protein HY892_07395 [Deltaproteobacteria bacterium]|nr:hypothetical protein [Deltaproteobacteria bacterium]
MKKLLKILILDGSSDITYLVLGPGITIRSTLSNEKVAQLLEKEAMDLILGPQGLYTRPAARKFPRDKAA